MKSYENKPKGDSMVVIFSLALCFIIILGLVVLLKTNHDLKEPIESSFYTPQMEVSDIPDENSINSDRVRNKAVKNGLDHIDYGELNTESIIQSYPDNAVHVEPIEASGTRWSASNFRAEREINHNGVIYTWYSQRIKPGYGLDELNANGRSISAEGYIIDHDKFIACASMDYPIGSVVASPFGSLKVYEEGTIPGVIEIYTDW